MTHSKTVLVSTPTFAQYAPDTNELLREYGCDFVELSRAEAADRDTLFDHLDGVDAWIVGYTTIDDAVLDCASSLDVVAKHGTGVDNIDLDAARARDVVVANAPGANANGVAELVVLYLLNYCRDLVGGDATVRERRWDSDIGREMAGKTLGVVGLGDIGQTVVERISGFDVECIAHDVTDRPAFREQYGVEFVPDLHELLGRANFVTTHVPLTDTTRGLVGEAELAAMRSNACLVNTARGGIVDEASLADALADDAIGGAALDVLDHEPPIDGAPYDALLADDRVTFTPHIGGKTEEAMAEISLLTARNVRNVFEGDEPLHRVA